MSPSGSEEGWEAARQRERIVKLSWDKYFDWKFQIQMYVFARAYGLWQYIQPKDRSDESADDMLKLQQAAGLLAQTLEPSIEALLWTQAAADA
jgi:hypothetical protein